MIQQSMDIDENVESPQQSRAAHLAKIDEVMEIFSETATLPLPADFAWSSTPTLDQIVDAYAPVGMKDTFRQFYRFLAYAFVARQEQRGNVPARETGTGKSLILRQCLQALQDEAKHIDATQTMFRVISINGIAVPGRNLNAVVMEILLQLTAIEFDDGSEKEEKINELLRLKKNSSFTNNIQLLTEALEIAHGDKIPVLFILDPLDAFIGAGGTDIYATTISGTQGKHNQHLLLYYLLDRVSTKGSLVSFIGMTHDVHCLDRLEKRTKSRADNAQFITCAPFPTYEDLMEAILNKLKEYPDLQQQFRRYLEFSDTMSAEQERVVKCLLREFRFGRDARWFSRIMTVALTSYRQECNHWEELGNAGDNPKMEFTIKHIVEAMLDMGAALPNHRPFDLRMQALADMSSPQVVLILAAKRILSRDTQQKKDDVVIQLTLERILNEYSTSIQKRALLSDRYSPAQLWRAFQELMEVGLFRPAADGGKLAFQYKHMDSMYQDIDMNTIVARMPLHMTVDIHRELKAVEKNTIQCSTALREWGFKNN